MLKRILTSHLHVVQLLMLVLGAAFIILYVTVLTAIHLHIGDEAIFDRFERARSIDLLYNTGKNTCHRYLDRIEQALITRGCKVRMLISDPNSSAWGNELLLSGLCPGTDIKGEI